MMDTWKSEQKVLTMAQNAATIRDMDREASSNMLSSLLPFNVIGLDTALVA